MSQPKKLTTRQLATIKLMYMEYKSISEIARAFKVARSSISWHINGNAWDAERKLRESEIVSSFTDAKKADFSKMSKVATTILIRSLENLATRHDPPTINEATKAADILKTLDNIARLDEGSPTDIIENADKPMDNKELKKKLSADPFANMEKEDEETKQ